MRRWGLGLLFFWMSSVGCGDDDGRSDAAATDAGSDAARIDAGAETDAATEADADVVSDAGVDATVASDAGADASAPLDAGFDASAPVDAGHDAGLPVDAGYDAGVPARSDHHIHIDVDNFCNMTVTPTEITIPSGQTAYFDWHNHSADYAVDVWMSYGGGYLDLATGATWDEPVGHCLGPTAHDEYADISTACSSHRFTIHCL